MNAKSLIFDEIKSTAKDVFDLEIENFTVEIPDNLEFGDYASNVAFLLAPKVKHMPLEIAKKLSYKIAGKEPHFKIDGKNIKIFESVEYAPPGFINFKLSPEWLKYILEQAISSKTHYGSCKKSQKSRIIVEFSQPNPNKPMHVGHARNNFLGDSLSNIFEFLGYDVIRANYMNDWGTHICKSMLMYKKYANGSEPDKKPDHYVGEMYMMYEKEEEKNPDIAKEALEMFNKLESGDKETLELWKKITSWAYKGWEQTYEDQGISFDVWFYQNNYKHSGKEVVKNAIKKGIAEKDETGAVIARLEKYGIPDKVLLRSDGTSVYATQDIQLAEDGYQKYKYDKRLYVVDYRQSDYFKQIFKIAEVLDYAWYDKVFHVAYGTVDLPEGKMSSRKGLVINSDEAFEKVLEAEKKEISSSVKKIKDEKDTVKKVAMSAFKYGMLKVEPKQDIVFDVQEVTRFEGNTGPYLLYTYARCSSVIEKYIQDSENLKIFDPADLNYSDYVYNEYERKLLKEIESYPEIVIDSGDKMSPHVICNYLFSLAQRFNTFYSEVQILGADNDKARNFRLTLTYGVSKVLKSGLGLMGIDVVERM